MTTLVIVESPGKIKKIGGILGSGYTIMASVGHVRDLPEKDIGVEAPDFRPQYVPTDRGKDVLKKLKTAVAAADDVLLATDPDREGEAIAWHLADALKLKKPKRITFQSITAPAVKAAIAAPRALDMPLVYAQEARRVLDRLVGWMVSGPLSSSAHQKLSAGRVQSPAVRLIVERERAIRAFKPIQHYGVELVLLDGEGGRPWRALWETKPHRADGQDHVTDQQLAERVATIRNVRVIEAADGEAKKGPPSPFTTSTLQQAGQAALKFKTKLTMDLAQKLYERGDITYHRTDTPNLSDDGYNDVAAYAKANGLPLSDKRRSWKAKEGAQEAHEAVRPSHIDVTDAGETPQENALYRLIWARTVASQLADATYAVRTATLAGETAEGLPVQFIARGRTLTAKGWKAIYEDADDDKPEAGEDAEANEADNPVPALTGGQALTADSGRVLTKTTKAPGRFKEGTLVKELERLGIGRPSTYAAILGNITTRDYITEDSKGFLAPAPAGEAVVDGLVNRCQFINLDYTRELEDSLDAIASGKAAYLPIVAAAFSQLTAEIGTMGGATGPTHACPECGKSLRRRSGKNGFFWGCSGYPDCTVTLPDKDGSPGERKAVPPPSGEQHACPKCSKPLRRRQGSSAKGAYDFWGCSGYPKCDGAFRSDKEGHPIFPTAEGDANGK